MRKPISFHISWRAHLILICESVLVIFAIVMVLYINSCLFQMLLENNEANQLKTLQYIKQEILDECASMENVSASIILSQNVKRFSHDSHGMDRDGILLRRDIVQELDKYLSNWPILHSISVRNASGAEVRTENNYTYNVFHGTESPNYAVDYWQLISLPAHSRQIEQFISLLSFTHTYHLFEGQVQIVLNIAENSFADLYSGFVEDSAMEIFLCKTDGQILSSTNSNEIGTTFDLTDQLNDNQGTIVHGNDILVYLTIPKLDWIVIERMPVTVFRRDIIRMRTILFWLLVGSMLILNVLLSFAIKRFLEPLRNLEYAMLRIQEGKIGYQIQEIYNNEFDTIIQTFNYMSQSIPKLVEQRQKYELSALRAQINPHFLFNTITTIKMMAVAQNAPHIKSALDKLVVLLRPLFKETNEETTLKEELDYTENYISLINLRFGGNVIFTSDVPDRLLSRRVPRLILQPIIENSIEHGFCGDYSRANITISCDETSLGMELTIQDNGIGIPEEKMAELQQQINSDDTVLSSGNKVGLKNVNHRIKVRYGDPYGISLAQNPLGGAIVIIKVPRIM